MFIFKISLFFYLNIYLELQKMSINCLKFNIFTFILFIAGFYVNIDKYFNALLFIILF